jgi:hypothetical protein
LAEEKKKLSAKEVVAAIRSGATDEFLMKKYGVSEKQLETLFRKLVEAGLITEETINARNYEETTLKTDGTIVIANLAGHPVQSSYPIDQKSNKNLDEEQKSIQDLVTRFKSLFVNNTEKILLRRSLTKNGWEKNEARRFVDQIALEVLTDPEYARPLLKRYKKYTFWGGLASLLGIVILIFNKGDIENVTGALLFGSIAFVWGLIGWLGISRRLRANPQVRQEAINFRPTKGNLVLQPVRPLGCAGQLIVGLLGTVALFILIVALIALVDHLR